MIVVGVLIRTDAEKDLIVTLTTGALTVAGGVMAISIVGKGRRYLEVEELLDTGAVIATSNTRTMVKNHLIIIILAVLGGIRDTRRKTIPDWCNVLHA